MQNFFDAIRAARSSPTARSNSASAFRSPAAWRWRATGSGARCVGTRRRKRSSKGGCSWISSTRRNRSSCAKRSASLPKRRSRPTSWSGTRTQIFPLEVIRKLGELGYLGADLPGRTGRRRAGLHRLLDHHRRAVARRSLGGHDRRGAHFAVHESHLSRRAPRSRSKRYIPKLATGEWIGCWSLTEPEAGSDAAGTRTTAVLQGDVLGAQRRQDVHHQRALRRCVRGHGGDRSRPRRSTGFRRSSWKRARPGSASARRKTSWACAPAPPAK